jgi:hypothetical protein
MNSSFDIMLIGAHVRREECMGTKEFLTADFADDADVGSGFLSV